MSKIEVNTVAPQCGTTLTLGESGDTVALGSGASQTGFGRTGTVDWDTTPKTATFTAINGDGFFCNTESGGFTANLPAGVAGAIVSFADYANTWNTGNLTISPNGTDKIGGVNENVVLTTQGQSVTFVFADSTQGWLNVQDSTSNERGKAYVTATGGTTSTCGDFKFHKFTGPGTFCVSAGGNASGSNTVQTLIVAGGGGGGFGQNCYGGGGGAGGLRNISCVPVSVQGYPVAVGAGGTAGNAATPTPSGNGSPSSVISNTSAGGGRGGSSHSPTPGASHSACSGGSGGGAAGRPGYGAVGAGNTPPVAPPQGNNGGGNGGTTAGGGGGGGASCAGNAYGASPTSIGGAGTNVAPSFPAPLGGSPAGNYAGGGGGTTGPGTPVPGPGTVPGGTGGGGVGSVFPGNQDSATAGTTNTGGGGGAGVTSTAAPTSTSKGAAGGSGIVIIKYRFQN